MSKTFNELEKGDKVYVISIQNSRFEHKPGEPVMKTAFVETKSKGYSSYNTNISITLDTKGALFPAPNASSHVFNNSYDTTGYKKVNSTVYATNKRSCIETAIGLINKSNEEQESLISRLYEYTNNNKKMIETLEKDLEMADFPDTIEEFAEMALA